MVTGDDAVDAVDLTSPARRPDAPACGPASRGPLHHGVHHGPLHSGRASVAVAAGATGVLVAVGAAAHSQAPSPLPAAAPATAYQEVAVRTLEQAAPAVDVRWAAGSASSSGSPPSTPVDVVREAPVAGPEGAAVRSRVGYRVLDGLAGDDPRPCRVPHVRVPAWRAARGTERALSCRSMGGDREGTGQWALREGTSMPSAPRGEVVVVREVVLVDRGRACSVAAWAVGPGASPPLGLDALRRVARALAGVRGAPA